MSNDDQKKKDRQEVVEAAEEVQKKKERMLKVAEDGHKGLQNLAEIKLEEAELEMEDRLNAYKQKHGGQQ